MGRANFEFGGPGVGGVHFEPWRPYVDRRLTDWGSDAQLVKQSGAQNRVYLLWDLGS